VDFQSKVTILCPSCLMNILLRKCPTTRHGGAWGESRCSSYSFSTSTLDGGEWTASRPVCALAPGKGPPVSTVQEAGWVPEPVWTQRLEEKSFRLCQRSNLDRLVIQPGTYPSADIDRPSINNRWVILVKEFSFITLGPKLLNSLF
jgi:hypothetical protein